MKKLLATIAIALMVLSPVKAETMDEKVKRCTDISEIAGGIARLQQKGVDLSALLSKEGLEDLRGLIIAIYSENNRYSSESMQARVISDVSNSAMLVCMKD